MSVGDADRAPVVRAVFAVPGDPETPTGGYAYARQLLARGGEAGLALEPWPLPGGFPDPGPDALAEAARRLSLTPAGWPVIVDGLALGVLPSRAIRAVDGPVYALCHHPLGLETGLSPERAAALFRSERAALGECAGVIATSAATARMLRRDFAVPAERLTVARPGTDPAPPASGSGGATVRILSVGSLIPRKGHDLLIDALAGLGDLDWALTIVGPADRDPDCAAALAAWIAGHGLDARVTLAGAADPEGLAAAYHGSDLFVLAARHEGFGMAFAEAMAHGLPVVGPALDAVAEATRGAARLVPPEDARALAAALRGLIGDAGARRRLAAGCTAAAAALPRWRDTAQAVASALGRAGALRPA